MRSWSVLYGIVFLALGILGFFPTQYLGQFLLGLFDANMWYNILYLITGGFGLLAAILPRPFIRLYLQVVGIIYTVLGVGGMLFKGIHFPMAMHNNTWLLIIAGIIALIVGFASRRNNERT